MDEYFLWLCHFESVLLLLSKELLHLIIFPSVHLKFIVINRRLLRSRGMLALRFHSTDIAAKNITIIGLVSSNYIRLIDVVLAC